MLRSCCRSRVAFAVCSLALLTLASCSGQSSPTAATVNGGTGLTGASAQSGAASAPASTPLFTGVPALPHDADVDPAVIRARRSSAVGEQGLYGSQAGEFEQHTAHVDAADHSCVLQPGPGELSWALYGFGDLLPGDLPLVIDLYPLGEQPSGPVYIGISDFTRGTWDWMAFDVSQQEYPFTIPTTANPISPGAMLYVVVATWDAVPLAIGRLGLVLDCPAPPPDGFAVEPGDGVQTPVHLSWVDPAISFDPDGAGPQQFAFNGVQIQRAVSADGPWSDLDVASPGITDFNDPGSIGNPPPDGNYYYRLMTLVTGAVLKPGFVLPGGVTQTINQLIAKFTFTPTFGGAGLNVSFNGGSSTRVGGPFKNIQWDYEGDGVYDYATTAKLTTSHIYPKLGRYYPTLKLTMDIGGGATMTDSMTGFVAIDDKRGDWSQSGRNSLHNSRSPFRGPKTATVRGSYTAPSAFAGISCGVGNLAYGDVYAACGDGNLYYMNASCGFLRKVALPAGAMSPPAVDRYGDVWVNYSSGLLTRKLACVWSDLSVHSYPPTKMTGDPVVTPDGLFVVAAAGGSVYMALTEPGPKTWYAWVYTLPAGQTSTTPAVDPSGFVYIGTDGGGLYKLNNLGVLLWKMSISFGLRNPVIGNDGTIYVVVNNNTLSAFRFDGLNYWQTIAVGGEILSGPAVAGDGNLYVSTLNGEVHAFTPGPAGGWEPYPFYTDVSGEFLTAPVIDGDGNLYLLAADGRVVSLTRKLFFRWAYDLGAVPSGTGLALGNDGTLYIGGTSKLVGLK